MIGEGRASNTARIEHEAPARHLPYLLVMAVTTQHNIGANMRAKPREHHIARRRDQSFVVNILEQTGGIIIRGAVNGQNTWLDLDASRKLAKHFALLGSQRRVCKPVDRPQIFPPTFGQQTIVIATRRNERKALQHV